MEDTKRIVEVWGFNYGINVRKWLRIFVYLFYLFFIETRVVSHYFSLQFIIFETVLDEIFEIVWDKICFEVIIWNSAFLKFFYGFS